MHRCRYRCTVCRTTSPVVPDIEALAVAGEDHRDHLHGGHFPDEEIAGRIDRLGRWYAALPPLTALHAHLADGLSDLHAPKTMGHPWWASAVAAFLIAAGALLTFLLVAAVL
ncbi:hypothetical protein [Streptomyces sp. NPDC059611]|uniref:hypothetical protein n=1 Tax=Streptomyces sp. NPDC059611 TaxID=3346884 RepID=UPI0036B740B5